MTIKVPDLEIIDSILNKHFLDAPIGSYSEEDENGVIYVKNEDGSLYAIMNADCWFELLDYKKEKEEIQ